ncbi:MAG: hypothetical protein EA339_02820 [Rhodobacteraceae bacterium]|nr:MAG: hypothetical protein EA339_02820 [Paracoccaceae bacterium]
MAEMLPSPGGPPRDIQKAHIRIFHARADMPAPWQGACRIISALRGGQSDGGCAYDRDLPVHCPPPADFLQPEQEAA